MKAVHLKLPATSANLGPGFDAVGLALDLYLEIEAEPAPHFSIDAAGRSPEICASLDNNLLIETYRSVLQKEGRKTLPLALRMINGIPLGMGCGSSAAVRLAGVILADWFGDLGWDSQKIVQVAAAIEGHPDNVAACWFGGLTVVAGGTERLSAMHISPPSGWQALLVLPEKPVSTSHSRSVLPASYERADVVRNLQNLALLIASFARARSDLMPLATADHLHQPYRMELCPLLPALLPLAGSHGIFCVTLSGAGPSVLLLCGSDFVSAERAVLEQLRRTIPELAAECLHCRLAGQGAIVTRREKLSVP